jgi:hypothetical protein
MFDTNVIHSFDFHHPQNNFESKGKLLVRHEEEFANAFARTYKSQFARIHRMPSDALSIFVREFPVHGNGIADLVTLSIKINNENSSVGIADNLVFKFHTLRSFEIKIENWRAGLMQAHRYRYFSNASILVLPVNKLKSPIENLHLFKKLKVGLWGFDQCTNSIKRIYTPRPDQDHIEKYNDRAIRVITALISA